MMRCPSPIRCYPLPVRWLKEGYYAFFLLLRKTALKYMSGHEKQSCATETRLLKLQLPG